LFSLEWKLGQTDCIQIILFGTICVVSINIV